MMGANPISDMLIADALTKAREHVEKAESYAREMVAGNDDSYRGDALAHLTVAGRQLLIAYAMTDRARQVATDISVALYVVGCYPQHLQPPSIILDHIGTLYDYTGHDTEETP